MATLQQQFLELALASDVLRFGEFTLKGIGLSAIIAILLNIVLPQDKSEENIDI
jgi:uracil permease